MWVALVDGSNNDHLIIETAQGFLKNKESLRLLYVIEVSREFPVDKEIAHMTEIAENYLESLEEKSKIRLQADIVQSRSITSALITLSKEEDVKGIILGNNQFINDKLEELSQMIKKFECDLIFCNALIN
ncbi:MAG: hypothetical protein ACJ0BB_00570 [Dehalococcoidia bacterium]